MSEPASEVVPRGVDLRLATLAAGTWIGALLGLHEKPWLVVVLGVVAIAGFSLVPRDIGLAMTVSVGLLGCLATFLLASQDLNDWRQVAGSLEGNGPEVTVVGRIVSDPAASSQSAGWRFTVEAESRVRLYVAVGSGNLGGVSLVRGSLLQVRGKLDTEGSMPPPALGFLRASELKELEAAPPWQRFVANLKAALSQISEARAGSAGPLIGGMAIGDDRGLNKESKEAMLTTSLTHLTAVSGSHIAISLSVISVLLPGRRRFKAVATWCFLAVIVAVVGPQPAVLRAVGMGGLAAWGLILGRGGQPLGLLFVVTSVTLLIDPWSAVSLGFALSTLATAGILTAGRGLTGWLKQAMEGWFQGRLEAVRPIVASIGEAVAIAVVAQAATLPVLALANPWLPTWGVVANLLVAPIVTPLTLLGLAAAATCLWWPAAASLCAYLAAPLAGYMEATALRVAGWPLARLPWLNGVPGMLLAAVLTTVLALAVLTGVKEINRWRRIGQ